VHQVEDQASVILRCTVNQPSRFPILFVPKRSSVLEIKISHRLNFVSCFAKVDSVCLLIWLRVEHYKCWGG